MLPKNTIIWIIASELMASYSYGYYQICNEQSALLAPLPESAFSSSSQYTEGHGPWRSKLNTTRDGDRMGGWSAKINERGQYIEADMKIIYNLKSVALQGRADLDQWITSFYFKFSTDGNQFDEYNNGQVLTGSSDRNTAVLNVLDNGVRARYVQLYPVNWHTHISLRWEIYGCRSGYYQICNEQSALLAPLPESAFSSSSQYTEGHGPWRSKLNTTRDGDRMGGWSAKINERGQYIEADMKIIYNLKSVALQGRADLDQWITSFYFKFSTDGNQFDEYNNGQVLTGSSDRNTAVLNVLDNGVRARYVQLYPVNWHTHISLRWEMYGCRSEWINHNVKAYYVPDSDTSTSFTEAERECALRHARLPVIDSREQDEFISDIQIYSQRPIWIDLSSPFQLCGCVGGTPSACELCRASWKWRDGSDIQYSAWMEEKPIGYPRECAVKVNNNGNLSWTDRHCSSQGTLTGFICQYDCHTMCHIISCEFTNAGEYICHCEQGYTGPKCDQAINECESFPCHNGAECQDLLGGFRCNCKLGSYGILCENVFDHCVSGVCVNGDCLWETSSFKCNCNPGYTGILCESAINECDSNPCQNGATCFDYVNTFKCICPDTFYGNICHKDATPLNQGIIALAVICGLLSSGLIGSVIYFIKSRRGHSVSKLSSDPVTRSENEANYKPSTAVYEVSTDDASVHYSNDYSKITLDWY